MGEDLLLEALEVALKGLVDTIGSLNVVIFDLPQSKPILHSWLSPKARPSFLIRRGKDDVSSLFLHRLQEPNDLSQHVNLLYFVKIIEDNDWYSFPYGLLDDRPHEVDVVEMRADSQRGKG